MKKNTEISLDINQSVQFHINILQGIIQRMSTNCVSCKAWCLTLVSVQLTLILNNNNPNYTFITILPTFLFFVLDAYYLSLEKNFRKSYDVFVRKFHNGLLNTSDLYVIDVVTPRKHRMKTFLQSLRSISVWPFYLTLLVLILSVRLLILH
ncbi:conserved hypothetical protein [Syntrophothermus lipocalidus DSM 12680]|uniref:Uncharacterized protein n=1 Tax=Syntrophothermus lipocalidus (strain DSM 12680 / TGB-C1) TaxID=643648 RepID=D7CNT5_SYNLT|nr:conserved hypothetical protein [Syntrophothermus lipocalidus DSM 12680]